MSDIWMLGYVLYFKDGGEPEDRLLHKGTEAECRELADLLPCVAYSGTRPLDRAELVLGKVHVPAEVRRDS